MQMVTRLLAAAVAVAMGVQALPPPTAGDAVLFDFEDRTPPEEISRRDLTVFALTSDWSSDGRHAAAITFQRWSKGSERWPAIIAHRDDGALAVTDFSMFRSLVWEMYNPGGEQVQVKVHLRDSTGRRFSKTLTLEPRVTTPCQVAVAELTAIDATDIQQLHFYVTQPASTFTVYLDSIRLSVGLVDDLKQLNVRFEHLDRTSAQAMRRSGPELPAVLYTRFQKLKQAQAQTQLMLDRVSGPPPASWELVRRWRERVGELARIADQAEGTIPCLDALGYARERGHSGFILGSGSSMQKIALEAGRFSGEFGGDTSLQLARNEHEHAQVVVFPVSGDLHNVSWRADDLRGPDGAVLPLHVRLVGYVDCAQPSYPVSRTGWWPDPLIEGQTQVPTVPFGEVLPLWISVSAPADAIPGDYEGSVRVSAEGLPDQIASVSVHVWPFALPEHTSLRTALSWRGLSPKLYPRADIPMVTQVYENWMQSEYHLNAGNIYGGPPNWTVERLVDLRSRGLNAINLGYFNAPREPDFDASAYWKKFDQLVAKIAAYMPTVEAAGLRDLCYIYCFDERPAEQLDIVFETAAKLKAIWPDIEIMTTAYDSAFGMDRPDGGAIDIWVPLTPKFDVNAEAVAKARALGRDIWWYICIGPKNPYANWFVEYAAIEPRLIMGAMTAKYRPGGFLYYAVNRWPLNDRVIAGGPRTDWNPASYKNNNGDGSIMCAGPNGPLATIRLENIRDGIEDYEYYLLLRSLLAEQPGPGVFRKLLQRVGVGRRDGVGQVSASVVSDLKTFTRDPNVLRAERCRVAREIERLMPAGL